jgi:amino acid transporter
MFFVIIPLALGFLGVIIYFALSKESPRIVRRAALIALGAVILSVLVCGIIVILGLGEGGEAPVMPDFLATDQPEPPATTNTFVLVVVILFLLIFLGIIVVLSLREQRKTGERKMEALKEK